VLCEPIALPDMLAAIEVASGSPGVVQHGQKVILLCSLPDSEEPCVGHRFALILYAC
jgi:hypothetical protein